MELIEPYKFVEEVYDAFVERQKARIIELPDVKVKHDPDCDPKNFFFNCPHTKYNIAHIFDEGNLAVVCGTFDTDSRRQTGADIILARVPQHSGRDSAQLYARDISQLILDNPWNEKSLMFADEDGLDFSDSSIIAYQLLRQFNLDEYQHGSNFELQGAVQLAHALNRVLH